MSTIKVDTYQTRGGASEIAIDKIKGVTAAGSMLVVGEGGTNTTSLQQGLAKAWANYLTNDGTSISDSFNVGSLTDSAVGRTYINFSNNMANTNAAGSGNVGDRKVNNSVFIDTTARAFNITFHTINNGDVDIPDASALIHGDLA